MEGETKPFGYQLLAVGSMDQAEMMKHSELNSLTLEGGLCSGQNAIGSGRQYSKHLEPFVLRVVVCLSKESMSSLKNMR